ncbi:aldose 1-epimerase [Mesorhizobium sp. B2-7-2]|uniref:aldose 1-epimerase n=1 Tax=Mesorhizobium sp. B2-7-2 TaxID=2589908 RepID=UPI001126DDE1|nr:aldose 1-epimerase [Mesorhizobium sp. B2-7-2]TPJ30293.1 aldose 1-epimerase [Mesorhizobium sp. B2-7-2]
MSPWILIENDRLSVRISPQGGAVVDGHTAEGVPFLRPYKGEAEFDVADCACFPLVPIGNRVEGNAFSCGGRTFRLAPNAPDPLFIHGDGWLDAWEVTERRAGHVELCFDKPEGFGSPHAYHARQSFSLSCARLALQISVTNTGEIALPFGLGFHPFFPRTPLTTLFAPASDWWTERAGHLPGERVALADDVDFSTPRRLPDRWLNNCFEGWSGKARIAWPEQRLGLEIEASPALRRYMLYAPDSDRSFFCLEPMSHAPNALKHLETDPRGLVMLAPGGIFSAEFAMTVFDWSNNHG